MLYFGLTLLQDGGHTREATLPQQAWHHGADTLYCDFLI
jgi:hypothetical protein